MHTNIVSVPTSTDGNSVASDFFYDSGYILILNNSWRRWQKNKNIKYDNTTDNKKNNNKNGQKLMNRNGQKWINFFQKIVIINFDN